MLDNSPRHYQKQYAEEGYAVFRRVLNEKSLNGINQHLEWLRRQPPHTATANLYAAPIECDPFWLKLVSNEKLLDIAELFVGSDIVLFGANYVVKWAGDAMPVLWHQDAPNWRLSPLEAVTLWLAIDDSTPANGCLRVIPKSHRMELHALQPADHTPNIFGWQTDSSLVEEEKAVDVILQAGDVSVHHPKLIHGSGANRSNHRRAGMSIRYIPAHVRIADNTAHNRALLLRGTARPGINHYHEFPELCEDARRL